MGGLAIGDLNRSHPWAVLRTMSYTGCQCLGPLHGAPHRLGLVRVLGESERPEVAGATAFSSLCLASRLELRVSGGSRSSRSVKAYPGGIFAKGLSSKISKDSYDGSDLNLCTRNIYYLPS